MSISNRLLVAFSFTFLSDGIFVSALPILAIHLNEAPSVGAIFVGIFNLPWLLVSIVSGSIIDKYHPALILKFSNLIRTILSCLLALIIYNIPYYNYFLFCFILFLIGTCEVFYENTCPTIPPKIIPEKELFKFNSKIERHMRLQKMVIGKLLGPLLIQFAPFFPILINAALFSITSFLIENRIKIQSKKRAPLNFKEVLTWILQNSALLKVFTMCVITNALFSIVIASIPIYLLSTLNLETYTAGIALGTMGLGYTAGAFFTKYLNLEKIRNTYILASGGISISILMIYFTNNLISVSLCLFTYGTCMSIRNVVNCTFMQQIIPNNIIGRVTAVQRTFSWGACSIFPLIGAYLIDSVGVANEILIFGCVSLITLFISIDLFRKNSREFVIET